MTKLFDPLDVRGVRLPNRLMLSPMCQYSAKDGFAGDHHVVHYGKFALGGFGLVMVEATAVSEEGRITHGDLGLWNDGQMETLTRIANFSRSHGAIPGIQIGHAGPKASLLRPWDGDMPVGTPAKYPGEEAWLSVSASTTPAAVGWPAPHRLDRRGMDKVLKDFVSAAERAAKCGFDILELHFAHGFLISSFLSPLTNDRQDEYGGNLGNRMRFPLEVAAAVRHVWPELKPLFVRISAVDGSRRGWSLEDTVHFAKALKAVGVDVIDNSSGSFGTYDLATGYGYQVPFSRQVRSDAGIATVAVGYIVDPHQAQAIVEHGDADVVALGHAALADPNFPWIARRELEAETHEANYKRWHDPSGWWLQRRARKLECLGPPTHPT